MRFSKRLDQVPPYLFAELERKISAKESEGIDVISLGIGDPDLPTPEPVIEAAARAMRDPATHDYPTNHGDEARSARPSRPSTATASASTSRSTARSSPSSAGRKASRTSR